MNRQREKRVKMIVIRLTQTEYERVEELYKKSRSRDLSSHLRAILLKNKICIQTRNQSMDDFMEELGMLKKELNAIGGNFNQLVKQLHSLKYLILQDGFYEKTTILEQQILNKTSEIEKRINQFAELWLQRS